MYHKRNAVILFILFALIAAACGSGEPQASEPIATLSSNSARPQEDVVEEPAMEVEEAAEEAPIAVAPSGDDRSEPLPPAPSPAPTRGLPTDTTFEDYGVNPYIPTEVDHLSTFALDVDTASYSVARRYINEGVRPPHDAIRVEEFVNAFDQGYQAPPNAAFALYADGAPSPFHHDGTHFLRVGVQGYEVTAAERPPAALTFVIDVSGSMGQENRLGLVKESLQLLVDRMRADDTVAIVVYGSSARTILNPTRGSDRATILDAIYSLRPEGSTNLEAGLLMGYELANRAYQPGGINRVILASDGVANVGATGPDSIVASIRSYADAGITLTTLGYGMGNYNDVMMEQLADNGDGNYAYIDTMREAEELFINNLMSTLQVIALDAKIQVDFNSEVVQMYRLIGYENRAIADQDFRNDSVDAGEIGAGHTVAAVYAVQLVPETEGRIATIQLRWQAPDTRRVEEINGNFNTWDLDSSFDDAPLHYQLAVVVSQYAEVLRGSRWAEGVTLNDLSVRAERLATQLDDTAVSELATLIARTNRLY